jgi:aspartate kinase/aspartokinase/homoserine dehydrogenase 1
MQQIVLKVGGSNLKDTDSIGKVIDLIRSYEEPVIMVVSAFYGVTDRLIDAVENNGNPKELSGDLLQLHSEAINRYIPERSANITAISKIRNLLEKLESLFNSGEKDKPYIANEIISYGERLSAVTLSDIIRNNGKDCAVAFPEKIGFVSNSRYYQGTILLKRSAENLKKKLYPETTYVIPGFYGINSKGHTVLLGRGGSDYSAACIANGIDASYLDVWKDVEGYLSGDPKIIKNVKKIEHLSYLEAAELSYFGAKILHPRTIRPLVEKNIEIRLFNPEKHKKAENPATVIGADTTVSPTIIKSITYSKNIALLKLKGSGVGIKKGILAQVTKALDDAQINIRSVVTSQTAIHFIFLKEDLEHAKSIIDHINKNNDFDTEIDDNIAWIAAIGNGINEKEGIAASIFASLARKEINVRHIVLGASEVAIYFIIKKEDVEEAVNAINDELFHH